MAKIKPKSRKNVKVKAKLKSKSKATPKRKLKSKAIPKKKSTKKKAIKKKATKLPNKKKVASKKKRVLTAPKKKKSSPKTKKARTVKSTSKLSDIQKEEILATLAKIINLHKFDQDGLKSLTKIDQILDKYNQKYAEVGEKFDAIVKYGMEENPSLVREHVFVPVQGKDKETLDLYKLLLDVGKGKVKFVDVKRRLEDLYTEAVESRQ